MAQKTEASTIVRASPWDVLTVILAFEEYPEWIAEVKRVEVLSRDEEGRGKKVYFLAETPLGRAEYTLEYSYGENGKSVSWKYLGGTVKDVSGEYLLEPVSEGTRVTYRLQVDVGFPVPGILRRQVERMIMRAALEGLRRRAEAGRRGG